MAKKNSSLYFYWDKSKFINQLIDVVLISTKGGGLILPWILIIYFKLNTWDSIFVHFVYFISIGFLYLISKKIISFLNSKDVFNKHPKSIAIFTFLANIIYLLLALIVCFEPNSNHFFNNEKIGYCCGLHLFLSLFIYLFIGIVTESPFTLDRPSDDLNEQNVGYYMISIFTAAFPLMVISMYYMFPSITLITGAFILFALIISRILHG